MKKIIIIITCLFIITILNSCIKTYKIKNGAMEPTLLGSLPTRNHAQIIGDHIISKRINKKKITRGDMIIFQYPYETRKDFIKRVIGLPGEKFQIKDKSIYIDDKQIKESYLRFGDKHYVS
ncbi:MAG: signal peptidase I, partial [Candidatus Hodarchaeales archaeon]